MKKISIKSLLLWTLGFGVWNTNGFNPSYNGTNPYESLACFGNDPRFIVEDYVKYFPYYKHYDEQIPLVDTTNINLKTLPYPYNTLTQLSSYNGWGYYINFEYVPKLIAANHITNVIEIGSDLGRSTRHIASLLPKGGKLYAIDTWDFTSEGYHNQRYLPFLSNVVHAGLTDKIIPVKKTSQEAVEMFKLFRLTFDMVYVDGSHETPDVLNDLENYYPLLSEHGVMCGDDWMLKSVRAAIVQFAQKYNFTIYCGCNFWFLKDEGAYQQICFLEADDSIWIM